MEIITTTPLLREPSISTKKNAADELDIKIMFFDDGINHECVIEGFSKWKKSNLSLKRRYKLKIEISRTHSTSTNSFEFTLNKDSFTKNKYKNLFKDFVEDKEGYNMLLIELVFKDKDKIFSEKTGKAVTANEDDDDGDEKGILEHLNE